VSDYFVIDPRWEPHKIATKEEYEQKVVIKGCFHECVPDDVVNAFETVEYLMAHA
jgi:hypothetical protein